MDVDISNKKRGHLVGNMGKRTRDALVRIATVDSPQNMKTYKHESTQSIQFLIQNLTSLGQIICVPNYILVLGVPKPKDVNEGECEEKNRNKNETE